MRRRHPRETDFDAAAARGGKFGHELTQAAERSYLLQGSTKEILAETQQRTQEELNKSLDVQEVPQ